MLLSKFQFYQNNFIKTVNKSMVKLIQAYRDIFQQHGKKKTANIHQISGTFCSVAL